MQAFHHSWSSFRSAGCLHFEQLGAQVPREFWCSLVWRGPLSSQLGLIWRGWYLPVSSIAAACRDFATVYSIHMSQCQNCFKGIL